MRELVRAEGGDLSDLQVAYPLVNAFLLEGGVDYATMFAEVPRLAASGVTDFRTLLRVPTEYEAARTMLSELADRFAEASRTSHL
ncbi:hypothetical protein [Actinomadura sp. NTSP31]|uniref:hypothetical protein n=1 Tax=Actinomadura sp. NTSP31 TaxID=1735447 RepID=UPI0035C191B8